MADTVPINSESLEQFREYLLMLARAQFGPKYWAVVDPEAIVNQTLFDAHQKQGQFRGKTEDELIAWLKRMLSDDIKDAIKFHHRRKRDIDREDRNGVSSDWEKSCCRFVDITCGLTSPSLHVVRQERETPCGPSFGRASGGPARSDRTASPSRPLLAETAESLDRTVASVVGLLRRG